MQLTKRQVIKEMSLSQALREPSEGWGGGKTAPFLIFEPLDRFSNIKTGNDSNFFRQFRKIIRFIEMVKDEVSCRNIFAWGGGVKQPPT